jgi:hypothetical protein
LPQTSHANQSTDFEIFLDNYLRSFDPSTSNSFENSGGTGAGSDFNPNHFHSSMHIRASEDFLHGALTGDWAGFSRANNSGASTIPVAASFRSSDDSEMGSGLTEGSLMVATGSGLGTPGIDSGLRSQQAVNGSAWDLSAMSTQLSPSNANGGQSHYADFTYHSSSPHGRPGPSNMSATAGVPHHFYSDIFTTPGLSSFQPPDFGTSVPTHPNQVSTTASHSGNIGDTSNIGDLGMLGQRSGHTNTAGASMDMSSNFDANDEQAAQQWDGFLRGFNTNRQPVITTDRIRDGGKWTSLDKLNSL